jgi:pimeloyl-ACP methyl ester carboxylesterase
MRTNPHRVAISGRDRRSAVALETSASQGSHALTSPRSSAGAARDRRQQPPALAAPVLIHHPCDPADDQDGGDAPSALLLEGPVGASRVWQRLVPVLSRRGVRPCTLGRPDYAARPGVHVDPFADAAAIAQLLDDQHCSPAVIVGHSLGANVALALAASAPRHVRALVLLAPAPGPQSISITDRVLAAPLLGPALTCLGFRAAGLALHLPVLRRRILITRAGLNAGEAKEVVRRITYGAVWRSFTTEQRRLLSDARRRQRQFSRVDCPIIIVAGSHDRIVAGRAVTALHKRLPGSKMATTASGHLIPIDDPDSVADAVLRALGHEYRNSLSTRPFTRQRREASVQGPIHGNRDQR